MATPSCWSTANARFGSRPPWSLPSCSDPEHGSPAARVRLLVDSEPRSAGSMSGSSLRDCRYRDGDDVVPVRAGSSSRVGSRGRVRGRPAPHGGHPYGGHAVQDDSASSSCAGVRRTVPSSSREGCLGATTSSPTRARCGVRLVRGVLRGKTSREAHCGVNDTTRPDRHDLTDGTDMRLAYFI